MILDASFSPQARPTYSLADRTAIVVDVLRATTTMVQALASGARRIVPAATIESAHAAAAGISGESPLLCGERDGRRIPGFHLGNSPLEFTRAAVADRVLVMTTTNGTRALLDAASARRVLVAAATNRAALARAIAPEEDVVVWCAGRAGGFALEDAVCGGLILRAILERHPHAQRTAQAEAALRLGREGGGWLLYAFERSGGGRALIGIGHEPDLQACAEVDRHAIVPAYEDRQVTV